MNEQKNYWESFVDWLHNGDLVPVVVIVSVYHYYKALGLHDPFFVALPIALAVDLTHYRTVQRAVKNGRFVWWFAAFVTTGIVFGLQYFFYSEGSDFGDWRPYVYAAIVPMVIFLMAWLKESSVHEIVENWQEKIKALQEKIKGLQTAAEQEQAETKRLQESNKRLQNENKQLHTQTALLQTAVNEKQESAKHWQAKAQKAQEELNKLQPIIKAWQSLNDETQALAYFLSGQSTVEQVADEIGVKDTRTVQSRASKLNGVGH